MAHDTHSFELAAHPESRPGAVRGIGGSLVRTPSLLRLAYRLQGDPARLRVPPAVVPRAADELWRHTCFELFVVAPGQSGYFEFNFSPSGEWALYRFSGYRARVPFAAEGAAPEITARHHAAGLELDAVVPLVMLPPAFTGAMTLAISAVVEAADGTLSYWALRHPAATPDFHHPEGFQLDLP